MKQTFKTLLVICLVIAGNSVFSQSYKKLMHDGVKLYKEGNYQAADSLFNESSKKENATSTAIYNQAASQLKSGKLPEAQAGFEAYTQNAESAEEKSNGYLGLGNTKLQQKDYEGAINAYKKSLQNNPANDASKYNLSYALKMLQQQQQQQKNDQKQDKQDDKKEDEQKEQDKKEQKNKEDNAEDKNDQQEQDEQQSQQEKQEQEQQRKQQEYKKQNAERLLDALNEEEQKIQKQVKEGKGKKTDISIEKDW